MCFTLRTSHQRVYNNQIKDNEPAWEIREIHSKVWPARLKEGGLLEYPGTDVKKVLIWICKK
jgi:hypothetical protein